MPTISSAEEKKGSVNENIPITIDYGSNYRQSASPI
jgi:hypothetical protein